MNVYPFIAAEKAAAHHVTTACALLEVSTSAYYQWSRHVPSPRERSDAALGAQIERIHHDSRGTYGAPRVHAQLHRDGVCVGPRRVARLMRERGLAGRCRRRFQRTTIPDPRHPTTVDLLQRHFDAAALALNRAWCGDITYVRTWEGWLYLASVIDIASRRVVGWAMADHMRSTLVADALRMAVESRRPPAGADLPRRPRLAVHGARLHRVARGPRDPPEPLAPTPVLGQRGRGELVRDAQGRTHLPPHVADACAGTAGDLRVHRGFLQSPPPALRARLPQPRGL